MLELLGVNDLLLFVAAGLLLNITPGADLLYVAGQVASGGRRAGLLASLGIGVGCLFHVMLAAIGLSAVLAKSDLAYTLVKWAGAGYLIWMGGSMLFARGGGERSESNPVPPGRGIFWRGVLTNALNPKVALFFLAFLPQFISAQAPHPTLAFVVLGLVFTVNGTLVTLFLAWGAGLARDRYATDSAGGGLMRWMPRFAGAVFIGLGLRLALSER